MLGLFFAPKFDIFRYFFEVPIFNRILSVLGRFGGGLGRVLGGFGRVWGRFGEGLGKVWAGFGWVSGRFWQGLGRVWGGAIGQNEVGPADCAQRSAAPPQVAPRAKFQIKVLAKHLSSPTCSTSKV